VTGRRTMAYDGGSSTCVIEQVPRCYVMMQNKIRKRAASAERGAGGAGGVRSPSTGGRQQ